MEIVASTGNEKVEVRVLDAASFASVRAFAHEWGAKPVDVLVKYVDESRAELVLDLT